jgi:ElaB/YqjD/DUF883 family membrane-anchored ribosome-binding protein
VSVVPDGAGSADVESLAEEVVMSAEAWDSKTEKKAADAMAAAQEAATRGAEFATERVSDLAKQGQRVARGVDRQLEDYTGRSSEAWLDEGARLIKSHPWKAVAAIAVVVYLFGKLRG